MNMETARNTAISAMFQGGGILSNIYGNSFKVDRKGRIDLVTGFLYDLRDILPELLLKFASCLYAAQGVRRLGSADLSYLACGRLEGFREENLKEWDTAAGILIAQEA